MHSRETNSSDTQERLYKMLEKLQTLARDIPTKYQQRLPYDLLSSLAHVLLDSTVFEIVRELAELQHMTEKSLHQQHSQMVNRHKVERDSLTKTQREEVLGAECQGKEHVLALMLVMHQKQQADQEIRQAQEVANTHLLIQQVLDQKVAEQQTTMQQVGVPGFHQTQNPKEVKVQMYIMDFIVKIAGIKIPP